MEFNRSTLMNIGKHDMSVLIHFYGEVVSKLIIPSGERADLILVDHKFAGVLYATEGCKFPEEDYVNAEG